MHLALRQLLHFVLSLRTFRFFPSAWGDMVNRLTTTANIAEGTRRISRRPEGDDQQSNVEVKLNAVLVLIQHFGKGNRCPDQLWKCRLMQL